MNIYIGRQPAILIMILLVCNSYSDETIVLTASGPWQFKSVMDKLLDAYTTEISLTGRTLHASYSLGSLNGDDDMDITLLTKPDYNKSFIITRGQTGADVFTRNPAILSIPILGEPISIITNLKFGYKRMLADTIGLTGDQISGIFDGTITYWDDNGLISMARGLPSQPIVVFLPESAVMKPRNLIKRLVMRYGPDCACPPSTLNSNFRLVSTPYASMGGVAITDNSIGVAGALELDKVDNSRLLSGVGLMDSSEVHFAGPQQKFNESIAAVKFDANYQADIILPFGGDNTVGAYPFGIFLFMALRKKAVTPDALDCEVQLTMLRFALWMSKESATQGLLNDPSITLHALPDVVVQQVQERALKEMRCGPGDSISVFDLHLKRIQEANFRQNYGLPLGLPLGFLFVFAIIIHSIRSISRRMLIIQSARQQIYMISDSTVKLIRASKEKYRCMMQLRIYLEGHGSDPAFLIGEHLGDVVILNATNVAFSHALLPLRVRLVHLMQIRHKNIARFYGIVQLKQFHSRSFTIGQFCPLGDLRTVLDNRRHELDTLIKFGIIKGLTEGLAYLHSKDVVHGNLRSGLIYLEADWSIKIADWEISLIEMLTDKFRNREYIWRSNLNVEEQLIFLSPLLWTAPEILTAVFNNEIYRPTLACDIFSFAIIIFEILTRDLPYEYNLVPYSISFEQLFAMIRRQVSPLRPLDFKNPAEISALIPKSALLIMRRCWTADPLERPSIKKISEVLEIINSEMKRLADLTIVHTREQIERYKRNIIRHSEEIAELKKHLQQTKTDFLTRWVYEAEQNGEIIQPKFYQVAYVLKCSLVNYDGLSSPANGDAIIYFVERFYKIVDQVIPSDHNIHRLHSTGDEVTLVGAIPSGGVEYASKLATVAFDLLVAAWHADLMDMDWERMEIRVGISCGPMVAGISGNVHRLFTVIGSSDEAAAVESACATYRILVTEAFQEALKLYPDFTTLLNSDGKHVITGEKTFWLIRKEFYKYQDVLDQIARIYPEPDENGRIPEVPGAKGLKEYCHRKTDKTSLHVKADESYIEKDPHTGYLIEHRHHVKETSSLPVLTGVTDAANVVPLDTVVAHRTHSRLFGSMLGAQGFSSLRHHHAKHKHKMLTQGDTQHKKHLEKLFAGQLGVRRGAITGETPVFPPGIPLNSATNVPSDVGSALSQVVSKASNGLNTQLLDHVLTSSVESIQEEPILSNRDTMEEVGLTVEQRVAMLEKSLALEKKEDEKMWTKLKHKKKKKARHQKEIRERISSHSAMVNTGLWISQLPDEPTGKDAPEPLLTVNDDAEIRERTLQSRIKRRVKNQSTPPGPLPVEEVPLADDGTEGPEEYITAQPIQGLHDQQVTETETSPLVPAADVVEHVPRTSPRHKRRKKRHRKQHPASDTDFS